MGNLKTFLCVFVLLTLFSGAGYSQSLKFCEEVNSEGEPVKQITVFSIEKGKGGTLKFLTKLPFSISTKSVLYEIYTVDGEGNETYKRNIKQDVNPAWMWFYKDVKFTEAGTYNIKVYDGDRNHLVTSYLTVQYY